MNLQTTQSNNNNGGNANSSSNYSIPDLSNPNNDGETIDSHQPQTYNEDIDSSCSTPYVSAPSSPGRGYNNGFYYSAPASPMHFAISSSKITNSSSGDSSISGFEFEFSARFVNNGPATNGSMSSADELFLNGQIRPMKLSTHLQRPQVLTPLIDLEVEEDEDGAYDQVEVVRGRDLRNRSSSLRRRTRSLSPLRNSPWHKNGFDDDDDEDEDGELHESITEKKNQIDDLGIEEIEEKQGDMLCTDENRASVSASSSRSSSAGRSSKRWVFLKDFLYRSKSEGRSSTVRFWTKPTMAFSPAKEKKHTSKSDIPSESWREKARNGVKSMENFKAKLQSSQVHGKKSGSGNGRPSNGVAGKRRVPPSPHELHYTTNRAQAEEMRKKTFLPYKQGLLGCLGFSSKGYGAMNGFARALNPVSSR